MTDLKTKTARIAAIALLSAAPLAAFAGGSGTPQQSVDADPNEYVEQDSAASQSAGESMEDTARATDEDAYDADVVENTDGSLVEDDAKSDG